MFYVLGGAVLLVFVGFLQTVFKIRDVVGRRRFTSDYFERLKELLRRVQSHGYDEKANETHGWLIHRGGKMQQELGTDGIMVYREPFGGPMWPNYELRTNMIPKLRDESAPSSASVPLRATLHDSAASAC